MSEKLYGNYRGVVVNVDDPLKASRVKVSVYGLFDGITPDRLPWAQYADPFMGGSKDKGGAFTPDVGDRVWVFFECGDPKMPVYFQGAPSAVDFPEENTKDNRVFKTKKGHKIEFDDENDVLRITHSSGSFIEFDDTGKCFVSQPEIDLGDTDGMQSQVLGNNIWEAIRQLAFWADTHTHISPFGAPTTPTADPIIPDITPFLTPGTDEFILSTKNRVD